jgi:hypothetical protein
MQPRTTEEPNGVAQAYWAEVYAGLTVESERPRRRSRSVKLRVKRHSARAVPRSSA